MLRNPDLEPNVLWTLTDAPETTDNTIQIKEKDRSYYLVRKLYPADEYERILRQAAEYSIYFESDMETSQGEYQDTYRHPDIAPNDIVVKDGSFVGVLVRCEYILVAYMHFDSCAYRKYNAVLFTDGTHIGQNEDSLDRAPGNWHSATRYFLAVTGSVKAATERIHYNPNP